MHRDNRYGTLSFFYGCRLSLSKNLCSLPVVSEVVLVEVIIVLVVVKVVLFV